MLNGFTDGAARGNPGPAAYAYILADDGGHVVGSDAGYLGWATNNEAEYQAVITMLSRARTVTGGPVRVHSDSELVIRQLTGVYQVRKSHLKALFNQVKTLEEHFERVEYVAVPREHPMIRRADEMCNEVLDREAGNQQAPPG